MAAFRDWAIGGVFLLLWLVMTWAPDTAGRKLALGVKAYQAEMQR